MAHASHRAERGAGGAGTLASSTLFLLLQSFGRPLLCPGPSGSLRGSRDFPLQVTTRTSIPPGTTLQMLGSCSGARRMRCHPIGMSWASPMSSRSAFPFPAACCPGSWQVPLRLKNRGGKPVMAMMSPLPQATASASGLLGSTPDLLWLMGQSLSVFI